jgi:hypothetical protein
VSERFEEKFLFFADVKIVIEFYLSQNTRQPAAATAMLAEREKKYGICHDVHCVNDVCVYMVEKEMKVYRKS